MRLNHQHSLGRAILLTGLSAFGATSVDAVTPTCSMAVVATAGDGTSIRASGNGEPALYFKSNMDVNTDGTARSYHPNDPIGQKLAFNNMGNAITHIYASDGSKLDCSPRRGACFQRYIDVFTEARDAHWNRNGHRYFTTTSIIPWEADPALGRNVPCTIKSGPFTGYFISQTSRKLNADKRDCDQAAYIDSFTINAIVLPGGVRWRSQGIATDEFDLVVARNRENGELRYAIVGDRGPADKLGEGSIALTAALKNATVAPDATYATIKRLAIANVDYLVFPRVDAVKAPGGPVTQAKIDNLGRLAFERWGGADRLNACQAKPSS